jgi:hypothetical protein
MLTLLTPAWVTAWQWKRFFDMVLSCDVAGFMNARQSAPR